MKRLETEGHLERVQLRDVNGWKDMPQLHQEAYGALNILIFVGYLRAIYVDIDP